jgi:chromosome segregation ATPase
LEIKNLEFLSQAPVVKQIVEEHLKSFGSEQWNQLPEVFQLAVLYYIDQRLTEKRSTPYDSFFDRIRNRINCRSGFFGKYQELHPCPEESYAIEEISEESEADEPIGEEDISISNASTPQNSMRKESEHVNLNSIDINNPCVSGSFGETQSESMPPFRSQESTTSSVDEMTQGDVKGQELKKKVLELTEQLSICKAEIETLKLQVNDHNSQLTRHKCFAIDCTRQIAFLKKENSKLRDELARTLAQSNDELDKTRNELNNKLSSVQAEFDKTRNELNNKLNRIQTELVESRNERSQFETRLEQVESRMDQTELIFKDYEVRLSAETNIVVQSLIAHLREVVLNGKS